MVTGQERIKILEMIENGTLAVDEGASMMLALDAPAPRPRRAPSRFAPGQMLHLQVSDKRSGQTKVTVNLPLSLVEAGLNIAAAHCPDRARYEAVRAALYAGDAERLLDLVHADEDEQVEIYFQ